MLLFWLVELYAVSCAYMCLLPSLELYVYTVPVVNTNSNLVMSVVLVTGITMQFEYYIYKTNEYKIQI